MENKHTGKGKIDLKPKTIEDFSLLIKGFADDQTRRQLAAAEKLAEAVDDVHENNKIHPNDKAYKMGGVLVDAELWHIVLDKLAEFHKAKEE